MGCFRYRHIVCSSSARPIPAFCIFFLPPFVGGGDFVSLSSWT